MMLFALLLVPLAVAALHERAAQVPFAAPREPRRVPVVLGVMSKCPDALACEATFDRVLASVGDLVDIELTFIGSLNASDTEFGVTCKHGPSECAGNVHELCAAARDPADFASPPMWWSFAQCLNGLGKDSIGERASATHCALLAGFDWDAPAGLGDCVDGGDGVRLLQESVVRAARMGIQKSCTVVINGKAVCVRDDSQWKECKNGHKVKDFVKQIEDAYAELNDGIADRIAF